MRKTEHTYRSNKIFYAILFLMPFITIKSGNIFKLLQLGLIA